MEKKVTGQDAEGAKSEIIEKNGDDVSAEGTTIETTVADVKVENTELAATDSVTSEETQEETKKETKEKPTKESKEKPAQKPAKKNTLEETAKVHLKNYPSANAIYATEDGNFWLDKDVSMAKAYAAERKLKLHEFARL